MTAVGAPRAGMQQESPEGPEEQDRQLGAQLDGSRVQKVPAKIHSQNKFKTHVRKCEPAKLKKQVKEKTKDHRKEDNRKRSPRKIRPSRQGSEKHRNKESDQIKWK